MSIEITEITEHEDGSATLQADFDEESFAAIFGLGFRTAIMAGIEAEREETFGKSDPFEYDNGVTDEQP